MSYSFLISGSVYEIIFYFVIAYLFKRYNKFLMVTYLFEKAFELFMSFLMKNIE